MNKSFAQIDYNPPVQEDNNLSKRSDDTKVQVFESVAPEKMDPVNEGLPLLDLSEKPVSYFEFWPAWVFYIPVVFYWIALSIKYRSFGLPMTSNPNIELGGMVGESKIDMMNSLEHKNEPYCLNYAYGEKIEGCLNDKDAWDDFVDEVILDAERNSISFPFVIKPDLGCRGAGVSLINNRDHLSEYLFDFPEGRRFIVQELAPVSAEAGVFYVRMPGEASGKVTSITLKYMPYVIGDGISCLRKLIEQDSRASHLPKVYLSKNKDRLDWVPELGEHVVLAFAGSHTRGSIFRNGEKYITPRLTAAIDKLARNMPDFHYGRIDIKFKDIEALQRGEGFYLIEVNGASSEETHIWDSRGTLKDAFSTLFGQYRTLFKLGDEMRRLGHKPPSAWSMIKLWLREINNGNKYPKASTEF